MSRPKTRGECPESRPCPWVSCRYHLLIDAREDSLVRIGDRSLTSRTLNRTSDRDRVREWTQDALRELETVSETCALDVADEGATKLADLGEILGITREGIRQIEEKALRKMKFRLYLLGVTDA